MVELMRFKAQDDKLGRAGTYHVLLVRRGRKWLHVIFLDSSGLKLTKVPAGDAKWLTPMDTYPLKRAIGIYKRAAKKFGATHGVKVILREAT